MVEAVSTNMLRVFNHLDFGSRRLHYFSTVHGAPAGGTVGGQTANTPRLGPVSTSRHRIAELARQALGMAVAIAWLPGPAGTRRRVAKLSVEEPDAAEPARPDLWGARVSNDPGLPDLSSTAL